MQTWGGANPEFSFSHPNALCLSVDVTDPKQVETAVKKGIEKFGRIDVLSNNAGRSQSIVTEEETLEGIRSIFEVNYFGTLNTIKAILPHFRENHNGTIINNSSINGLMGRNLGCAYSSSKAAIEGLTEVLKTETTNFARVMVLEFGWFPGTELWAGKSIYKEPEFQEYLNLPDHYKCKKICENHLQKAISLIIDETEKEKIPLRYMLGYDCQIRAKEKIKSIQKDLKNSRKNVKKYSVVSNLGYSFPEKVFSVKNQYRNNKKYKVIRIFGIKFKLKQTP